MLKKLLTIAGISLAIAAIILILISHNCTAQTISEMNSYGELSGNKFSVYAKWTFLKSDSIDLILLHNGQEVARDVGNSGSSGASIGFVSDAPAKIGTYTAKLWSKTQGGDVYMREWTVPTLQLTTAMSPIKGQIGTTYVGFFREFRG